MIKKPLQKNSDTTENGVSCMLYTGYEPEEIAENKLFSEICSIPDILIPGRYHDNERNTYLKWRGSENQNIIFQNGTKQDIVETNDVEIVLGDDGSFCCLGYPDSDWVNFRTNQKYIF